MVMLNLLVYWCISRHLYHCNVGDHAFLRPHLRRFDFLAILSLNTSLSVSPLTQSYMADRSSIMAEIADLLGPRLYTACLQNNVAEVEILTSAGLEFTEQWAAAVVAAAFTEAMDVVSYCVQHVENRRGMNDKILWWCVH